MIDLLLRRLGQKEGSLMTNTKNVNHAALAALQIIAVSGGLAQTIDQQTVAATPKAETQAVANQLSLASIEESWLQIPRMCKAAGFHAQPTPIVPSERSKDVQSLYSTFIA